MKNQTLLCFSRAFAAISTIPYSRFADNLFGIIFGLLLVFSFGLSAQNVKKDCGKSIMLVGELLTNPSTQKVVALPFGNTPGLESCDIPNIGGDGMAVDQTKGIVYVGNPFNDPIQVYDFNQGQFLPNLNPTGDLRSYDVAISPDGNFLYRGYLQSGGGVQKIQISNGAQVALKAANTFTNEAGAKIWGVATDSTGKVYVTTGYNDLQSTGNGYVSTIQSIDANLSGTPTEIIRLTNGSVFVGVTFFNGFLWATIDGYNFSSDRVVKINPATGAILATYVLDSRNSFNIRPFDLAFASDGNLYATSFYGDCVYKVDITSGVVSTYIGQVDGVLSKNIAFVCGNFKCLCVDPKITTITQIDATCEGGFSKNDGKATISGITNGDKADINEGSTYGTTPIYGDASNKLISSGSVTFTNLKPNTQYSVRVWNESDNCFKDTVFTTKPVECFECPQISLVGKSTDTLCSGYYGDFFGVNVSQLGSTPDSLIKFVRYASPQSGKSMYTGGTTLSSMKAVNGTAQWPIGQPGSQFPTNTGTTPVKYYVYAILANTPNDTTCRPFVEKIYTVLPLPTFTATASPVCEGNSTFDVKVTIPTAGTFKITLARGIATIGNGPIPQDVISTQTGAAGNGVTTTISVPIADTAGVVIVVQDEATGCASAGNSGKPIINKKPKWTITSAPTCSVNNDSYSVSFAITPDTGTIKVNKGTLTKSNSIYTVTGIPTGTNLIITDSLTAVCKFDTLLVSPNCGCPPKVPTAVVASVSICANDPIPFLEVTVGPGETANWYDTETSTTVLSGGANTLKYKPTSEGVFWAESINIFAGCTSAVRVPVTLTIGNPKCIPLTVTKKK